MIFLEMKLACKEHSSPGMSSEIKQYILKWYKSTWLLLLIINFTPYHQLPVPKHLQLMDNISATISTISNTHSGDKPAATTSFKKTTAEAQQRESHQTDLSRIDRLCK